MEVCNTIEPLDMIVACQAKRLIDAGDASALNKQNNAGKSDFAVNFELLTRLYHTRNGGYWAFKAILVDKAKTSRAYEELVKDINKKQKHVLGDSHVEDMVSVGFEVLKH